MMETEVVNWELADWQAFTRETPRYRNQILKSICKAGEGNMNLTLRLQFDSGSVIAKHAPPFCFKYPMIPAPVERLSMELEFFKQASRGALRKRIPEIHHHDPLRNIALLEDLGECLDFGSLYEEVTGDQEADLTVLVEILSDLHHLPVDSVTLKNEKMRRLNHEYIFILPYTDKAFDLSALFGSLVQEAQNFRTDESLRDACRQLGQRYLEDGKILVHGDYYPRSWLKTAKGVSLIDPEFGFKGLAEFDVGVFIAHLKMSRMSEQKIRQLIEQYKKPAGFEMPLAWAFAGCEISRRLLHVAQLPLLLSHQEKMILLLESKQWIQRCEC